MARRWTTRTEVSTDDERRIIAGAIISDEFLEYTYTALAENLHLLKNKPARTILKWCLNYYDEHNHAPGQTVRAMAADDRYDGTLDREATRLIDMYLQRLAKDYGNPDHFDPEYESNIAHQVIRTLQLEAFASDLTRLLDTQDRVDMEDANELINRHTNLLRSTDTFDLDEGMMEISELLTGRIRRPRPIIDPWLKAGNLCMIFGRRGLGKSWLCHIITAAVTSTNARGFRIGPNWRVRRPAGVMLVDGEMSVYALHQRLEWIAAATGADYKGKPLQIMSSAKYQEMGRPAIDLSQESWRTHLSKKLDENKDIRLLILDNVACLFPGVSENDKHEWDPINQWMLSLRAMGVAVIYVHHSGKGGQQRGTSAREDALDTVIRLRRPQDYDPTGGAQFRVTFDKLRNLMPADTAHPFTMKIVDLALDGGGN